MHMTGFDLNAESGEEFISQLIADGRAYIDMDDMGHVNLHVP